jgi:hypothetical protein
MRVAFILSCLACRLGFAASGTAMAQPSGGMNGPFNKVADIPLGEKTSRFDYEILDPTTGRLFISKMGSGKLLVFNTASRTLVAQLDGFPKTTGVLAVPLLHKVYASVPGAGLGASLSVALGI